jgi:hypothetical protein
MMFVPAPRDRVVTIPLGGHVLAYDFPLLALFWTIFWFFIWVAWIFAVIWTFIDNFRRTDHSALAKALWALFIIFVPILGVFVYLVARPATLATM